MIRTPAQETILSILEASIYLSIYLSILSIYPSIYLSIGIDTYICIHVHIHYLSHLKGVLPRAHMIQLFQGTSNEVDTVQIIPGKQYLESKCLALLGHVYWNTGYSRVQRSIVWATWLSRHLSWELTQA